MGSSAVNRHLSVALALSCSLCLTVAAPVLVHPAATLSRASKSSASGSVTARAKMSHHQAPVSFEANLGQSDLTVKFLARGPGYTLFLTATEAVAALPGSVVRMQVLGANPSAEVLGLEPLAGRIHYFRGKDPKKWRTNIPLYAKVKVGEIYSGIDLMYYADHGQLEYDFVLAPGKSPAAIKLAFQGADNVKLTAEGALVLHTPRGEFRLSEPLVYQERANARQVIPGHYVLPPRAAEGAQRVHSVGIEVGTYDMRYPLVIDPVLSYSTYLGGSQDERGSGIAVDAAGAMYITGETASVDFPTMNPLQPLRGSVDAFVTKLTADGSALVYSTYLGGSVLDPVVDPSEPGPESRGFGIAVDGAGSAYVTGETNSADFPTSVNAFQGALRGRSNAFVAKLAPDGSALVYSTYLGGATRTLGGSGLDSGRAIAVDGAGSAYVAGETSSADFPTKNPLKPASRFGASDPSDAFVTKLTPDGSALLYSTYLGGSGAENAFGIAVDAAGAAYVTGETRSTNFPAPGVQASGFQTACAVVGTVCADAFVAKIDPSQVGAASLVYATYLGGRNVDVGRGIAVDGTGAVYVTGYTVSRDFPLSVNPAQATFNGLSDAFVTKFTPDGSALVYSTYLGGSDADRAFGIAVDAAGLAYVTGETASTDFPTVSAVQAMLGGAMDAFVTKIDPSQSGAAALVYSTYIGGSGADRAFGIAVDVTGAAYVTGRTRSTGFPAVNALQPTLSGGADAFITKVGP